jgi:flagellar basal body-associated protein FliL
MLTIICIVIALALLGVGGVFAMMAKDSNRRGQSGSARAASTVKQGRASGLD